MLGSTQKVKPCRHTWSSEEHEAVQTFFKKEIEDVSTTGNKGALHSKFQCTAHSCIYIRDLRCVGMKFPLSLQLGNSLDLVESWLTKWFLL